MKLGAERSAEDASEDGEVKSERAEFSKPRAPPPVPKDPNPPSAAEGDAPTPDFEKNPASGDEMGEPGATVGSKRRPGSPSMAPIGAAGLTSALADAGAAKPEPVPGPVEPAKPFAPDPPIPDPDRADGELNEKVPPEDSVFDPLNQVR